MQISTSSRPKMHAKKLQADPSPRLLSYQPMAPLAYTPYDHEENLSNGIVGKVTSRITGMFKDITSVVGSLFKNNEEDSQSTQSSFFARETSQENRKSYHFEDHPINQVNFSDLTGILGTQPQQRKKEIVISKPEPSNKMEISFTQKSFNYDNEQSDLMTASFHTRQNFLGDELYNDSESSMQLGKASPHSSNTERRKRKQKVNVIRVLNYCHVQFEKKSKEYSQRRPRDSYRTLKAQLIKGLPKPMPLRTNLPTIEFKYNKVLGQYDAISLLKKRKRRDVETTQEMNEQELAYKASFQENSNKTSPNPNALKKTKTVAQSFDKDYQTKVHINVKSTPAKAIGISYNPDKNPYISSETYETDETEEHEEFKEISYKNKIFEEDEFLSGKISPPAFNSKSKHKPHMTKESKGIKTGKVSKGRLIEAPQDEESPSNSNNAFRNQNEIEDENANNYQQEEIVASKPGLISPEKEVSFGDLPQSPSFPRQDLTVESQEDAVNPNNMSQEILPEQDTLSNRKVITPLILSEKQPEDAQADAPTTPTFTSNDRKRGSFLFGNQLNESREETEQAKEQNSSVIIPEEVKLEDKVEEIAPSNTIIEPEVQKIEVAQVSPVEPEVKPASPVRVIPDFLKAYQSPAQKEKEDFDSNPFLSGKKEPTVTFPFNTQTSSEAANQVDTANPFLNPIKPAAAVQPFSLTSSILASANNSESLNPVSSLPIFNSQPSQTSNNLFGSNVLSNQASSSPFANLSSNNTSTFNLFNNNNNNNQSQNMESNGTNNLFSSLIGGGNSLFQAESSMGEHNNMMNQNQNNGFSLFNNNNNNNQQGNSWFNNMQQQSSPLGGGFQFGQNNNQQGLFGLNQNNNNNQNSPFLNLGSNNNNNNMQSGGFSGLLGNTLNQGSSSSSFLNFNNQSSNNNQMNNNPFTGQSLFNSNNNSSSPLGNLMAQNNNSLSIQNSAQQAQDSARFLGNSSGSNASSNEAAPQGRVYRRILQPGAKNRDRAF